MIDEKMPVHLVHGHVWSDKAAVVLAFGLEGSYLSAGLPIHRENAQNGASPDVILHRSQRICLLLSKLVRRSTENPLPSFDCCVSPEWDPNPSRLFDREFR